jgi:hypothetical protein
MATTGFHKFSRVVQRLACMVFMLASLSTWARGNIEQVSGVRFRIDTATQTGLELMEKTPVEVLSIRLRSLTGQERDYSVIAQTLELKKGLPKTALQPVLVTEKDGSGGKIIQKQLKLIGNLDVYGSIRQGPGPGVPTLFRAEEGIADPIPVEVSFISDLPLPRYYFWEPRIRAWVPAEEFEGTEIIKFKQWYDKDEKRQYFSYEIISWPKDDRADAAGG